MPAPTRKFENKVEWGVDLAFEHERYLTEVIFKKPVIVYNYPKGIKAFYMRLNNDQKTLVAMDVLVPEVGELIEGSQREECLYILVKRKNGFRYIPTPITTTSDCEGAGEMFQVSTLFSDAEKLEKELQKNPLPSESDLEVAEFIVKEKGEVVSLLKESKASKDEIVASIAELNKAKENLAT